MVQGLFCWFSPVDMNTHLNSLHDELHYYYGWKADVDQNTLPEDRSKDDLTSRRLSRKLSVAPSLLLSEFDFENRLKNAKMPSNREVAVINKWKEVDKAEDDLERVREAHHLKLEQFEERWRSIEQGQTQIKQNLVKFNNFVKEKRMKIEEGTVKSKKHLDIIKVKEEEASKLREELRTLSIGKSKLSESVEMLTVFKVFLDKVLLSNSDKFNNISSMMARFQSLMSSRDSLEVPSIENAFKIGIY